MIRLLRVELEMKKESLIVLLCFLIGTFLAACAPSPVKPDAQVIEHYDRGVEYQQQGKLDLAIEEYTEAIALDPEYGIADRGEYGRVNNRRIQSAYTYEAKACQMANLA